MAARQSTSEAEPGRTRSSAIQQATAPRRASRSGNSVSRRRSIAALTSEPDVEPQSLEQAIESERGRLSAAQSVLRCLHSALLYSEQSSKHATSYAEVASIALRLVREAVHRLDSVHLKPYVDALRGGRARNGKVLGMRR